MYEIKQLVRRRVELFFGNWRLVLQLTGNFMTGLPDNRTLHEICSKNFRKTRLCPVFSRISRVPVRYTLTIIIPSEINTNASNPVGENASRFSPRISADSKTLITGLMKPKTAILLTGLYLRRTPHSV